MSSLTTPVLFGPVPLGHLLLRNFVQSGDRVVDATCGNGKDTLLLAELVGEAGHVTAFDIQDAALSRTSELLHVKLLKKQVTLLNAGHERLTDLVVGPLQAIVFNLGWLPGSNKEITTTAATTLAALEASLHLLAPAGLLLITCYPGHNGGDEESAAVVEWCRQLSCKDYFVWQMEQSNTSSKAPFCLAVQDARVASGK